MLWGRTRWWLYLNCFRISAISSNLCFSKQGHGSVIVSITCLQFVGVLFRITLLVLLSMFAESYFSVWLEVRRLLVSRSGRREQRTAHQLRLRVTVPLRMSVPPPHSPPVVAATLGGASGCSRVILCLHWLHIQVGHCESVWNKGNDMTKEASRVWTLEIGHQE